MQPRIYTYKITFEEVPYYYYGVHKERRYDEEYWGSPYANKWCWESYTPKKQILEFFEYSDEGWLEAKQVENRLIRPFLNDPLCLNENVGGSYSLAVLRKSGEKAYELGIGVHGLTKEQRSENSKKIHELGLGIHAQTKEQRIENSRKGGKTASQLRLGVHGLTPEQKSKNSKKGAEKARELGVGIFAQTKEERSEIGKKYGRKGGLNGGRKGGKSVSSQKWQCLETGHISNPAGLARYQNARGIDTTKRIRVK